MSVQLPHPEKVWHQYGLQIGSYTKQQMIDYGHACANEARKESNAMQLELSRYKEREKTMGWNQS